MPKVKHVFAIISWLLFLLVIVAIAGYLILIANGYQVNFKTFRIAKTGMIFLKSNPSQVSVNVNNQLKSTNTPYRETNLWPGRYDVKISQENYQDWQKSLEVEEGLISAQEYIKLFLANPKPLETTEAEKSSFQELLKEWPAKGLEIKNDSEIWFNDILVTRFFKPVKAVGWYPDLRHIIFQLDNEIRIMDADGTNNIKLAQLSSSETSEFIPYDEGETLLYKDGEDIKKIQIR